MNVLIAGDFCDRYRISDLIARGNYASLFDDIKYLTEQADVSIINFEFPIVLHAGVPITKSGPTLQGQPAAVDAVKYAGFNVCTLANNHILDQGTKCCIETRELLENAGIKTVGIGKNSAEAATVLYINQKEKGTLAIVNCCEHEFSIATATTAGANPLNPIQQYYNIQEARTKADYVLVIVHGGHEHYALPSPRMKETYRFFIDTGAISLFERRFHQFILSGMEGQDRCPSARSKRIWKLLHKLIEYFKFLVYIDPERLENTLTGLLDCLLFLLFRKEIQCFFNDFTEFRGRIDPVSTADLIRDRFCQLLAIRFV